MFCLTFDDVDHISASDDTLLRACAVAQMSAAAANQNRILNSTDTEAPNRIMVRSIVYQLLLYYMAYCFKLFNSYLFSFVFVSPLSRV